MTRKLQETSEVILQADKNSLLTTSAPKRCVVEKRQNIAILLASLFTHSVFEGVLYLSRPG